MKYELLDNLGLEDARKCNRDFGASLELKAEALAKGATIELPDKAANWLRDGKSYVALLAPAGKLRGVSDQPELKGVK